MVKPYLWSVFNLIFSGLDVCLVWYLRPTVFPLSDASLLIQYVLHNLSKTLVLPSGLVRVYQYTSVLSTEVSLTCYAWRAWLSPRAMAPSPSKKNPELANPRWRMYIE